MPFLLTDVQKLPISIAFKTAAGNPATVDGVPVWASSNPDIATVEPATDGLSVMVVVTGPLGTTQVSVRADADTGAGVEEIIGTLDVEVVGSKAAFIELTPGVPEPK